MKCSLNDPKCLLIIGAVIVLVVLAFVFLGQQGGQSGGQGSETGNADDPFAVGGGTVPAEGEGTPDFCEGGSEAC
ncbi:MAG: hypothetical protein V1676_04480 [Candidatus Diapherotrites archaeon]